MKAMVMDVRDGKLYECIEDELWKAKSKGCFECLHKGFCVSFNFNMFSTLTTEELSKEIYYE